MAETDRVVTRRTSLRTEVRRADPEWDRDSKRPIAYRFSNGREFREVEGSSYGEGSSPTPEVPANPSPYIEIALNEHAIIDDIDWFAQCDDNPVGYFPVSYDPATSRIRIETRQGAVWPDDEGRGVDRAELDGSATVQRFAVRDEFVYDFKFTITTESANASEWMSVMQVKNSVTGAGGVPDAFFISPALILSVIDEQLGFETRFDTRSSVPDDENPTPTLIWSEPLQRLHQYHIHIEGRFDPTGAVAYLIIQVDGDEVFNQSGFPFGYYCQYNYPKIGLYRATGDNTQVAIYEDFTYSITLEPIIPGAEAAAYIAEQPIAPTYWYDRAIAKFINGLADDGLFAKGIAGYICGVETELGAMVNIFDPTGTAGTKVGDVSHFPALGFKSTETTGGIINTGIAAEASTWAENSGCMAIVVMDSDEGVDIPPQAGDRFFTNTIGRFDHNAKFRLNSETNAFPDNQGEMPGIMIVNRVDALSARVLFGTGDPAEVVGNVATSLWDDNPDNWFYICGASGDRSPSAVGAMLWFEGLTEAEEEDLETHLQQLYLDLVAILALDE